MIVLLSVSMLWLLGMLAALSFAQDAERTLGSGVKMAITFGLVIPLASWLTPQPNWIAVLLACAACWRLIAGPMRKTGPFFAGASAALVAALQIAGGISLWLAIPVTALGLVLAFLWNSGPRSPRWEWVMVGVALALPPVGLANDILYGWHSATVLNQETAEAAANTPPAWAIVIIGAALIAGLVRGYWVKR